MKERESSVMMTFPMLMMRQIENSKPQSDCGELDEIHVVINMGLMTLGLIILAHRLTNG